MVNNNEIVIKVENTFTSPLTVMLDPPCTHYILEQNEYLFLKFIDIEKRGDVFPSPFEIKYTSENLISINIINMYTKLIVVFNDQEEVLWGY